MGPLSRLTYKPNRQQPTKPSVWAASCKAHGQKTNRPRKKQGLPRRQTQRPDGHRLHAPLRHGGQVREQVTGQKMGLWGQWRTWNWEDESARKWVSVVTFTGSPSLWKRDWEQDLAIQTVRKIFHLRQDNQRWEQSSLLGLFKICIFGLSSVFTLTLCK